MTLCTPPRDTELDVGHCRRYRSRMPVKHVPFCVVFFFFGLLDLLSRPARESIYPTLA